MSTWMAFRLQFTEKEVREFRVHLSAHKTTVHLAVSAANLATSSQNCDINENIEAEMGKMRAEVNQIASNGGLLGRSDMGDHGSVVSEDTDPGFALRRFLMSAETVFSGSPPTSPVTGDEEAHSVSDEMDIDDDSSLELVLEQGSFRAQNVVIPQPENYVHSQREDDLDRWNREKLLRGISGLEMRFSRST